MECNCCYEVVDPSQLSHCRNCKESAHMCHPCVLAWANEHNDISVCTICRRENVMENLPPVSQAIWIEERVIVVDTCCKYLGRCLWWLFMLAGLSYTMALTYTIFFQQTTFVSFEIGGVSVLIGGIMLGKNRQWFIAQLMPGCLHHDGVLDDW